MYSDVVTETKTFEIYDYAERADRLAEFGEVRTETSYNGRTFAVVEAKPFRFVDVDPFAGYR